MISAGSLVHACAAVVAALTGEMAVMHRLYAILLNIYVATDQQCAAHSGSPHNDKSSG